MANYVCMSENKCMLSFYWSAITIKSLLSRDTNHFKLIIREVACVLWLLKNSFKWYSSRIKDTHGKRKLRREKKLRNTTTKTTAATWEILSNQSQKPQFCCFFFVFFVSPKSVEQVGGVMLVSFFNLVSFGFFFFWLIWPTQKTWILLPKIKKKKKKKSDKKHTQKPTKTCGKFFEMNFVFLFRFVFFRLFFFDYFF